MPTTKELDQMILLNTANERFQPMIVEQNVKIRVYRFSIVAGLIKNLLNSRLFSI